jgi:hypothetical protein
MQLSLRLEALAMPRATGIYQEDTREIRLGPCDFSSGCSAYNGYSHGDNLHKLGYYYYCYYVIIVIIYVIIITICLYTYEPP